MLKSSSVVMRPLERTDAAYLLATVGAPDVAQLLPDGPTTLEEFEQFILWTRRELEANRYITLGAVPVRLDGAVGLFQLWPVAPRFSVAEWGFSLGRNFWGTGLFADCAALLLTFAFETLQVHRLEARVMVGNIHAETALRKLGAKPEGRLRQCFPCDGEYRDHVMWAILAHEWRAFRGPGAWTGNGA